MLEESREEEIATYSEVWIPLFLSIRRVHFVKAKFAPYLKQFVFHFLSAKFIILVCDTTVKGILLILLYTNIEIDYFEECVTVYYNFTLRTFVIIMAKKHITGKIVIGGKLRATRHPSKVKVPIAHQGLPMQRPSPSTGEPPSHKLTPVRVPSPQDSSRSSPRTSPGLLAGHYAGCKFSEPPLPSALPLPPQHWMQTTTRTLQLPFHSLKSDHNDIAQQLKLLLKLQA